MKIRNNIFKGFILALNFGIHFNANAYKRKEISDEDYMNQIEAKLNKRKEYLKILKDQGPAAYIEARGLKMPKDQERIFIKDLVRIMMKEKLSQVYVDRKKKLLVIEDDDSRNTFSIEALRQGLLKSKTKEKELYPDMKYSDLKTAIEEVR